MTFLKYFFGWICLAICFYELFALLLIGFITLASWGLPGFAQSTFCFWQTNNPPGTLVIRGYLWFFAIGFSSLGMIHKDF